MKADGGAAPVLQVQDLHKRFTLHLRGGLELAVLNGVSMTVGAGECVALVGASGRGKSTLMKCLYGSYHVDRGHLWLACADGQRVDLAQASAQQLIALRRAEIGHVSQFLRALPRVPALDVVAERCVMADRSVMALDRKFDRKFDRKSGGVSGGEFGGEFDPAADPLDEAAHEAAHEASLHAARARARLLLARLNLPSALWGLPPATFSGGEQQRINIARGFVQPARLLLLDEPTASLDAANRHIVIDLILEAKQRGTAIVGIFHDEEVRDAVADRCIDFSAA